MSNRQVIIAWAVFWSLVGGVVVTLAVAAEAKPRCDHVIRIYLDERGEEVSRATWEECRYREDQPKARFWRK